ncbi:TetR family transcriptional regulator [Brevibacterium sp. 50QC2O2]|uniref:TetR/AcrR family transcriptional regulator n=1 Tax=Brevibacterium sp. 50QC2O2 TaxID=2968459 RepID=UPI00211CA39E|nr:TetR family transcriptional regulator [Brevibacterium sp. 50QC2O2]
MTRKTSQARRAEILETTADQIAAHGTGGVRVADVARELGVSPALIMYHFSTLDALITRALQFVADRDIARLEVLAGAGGSVCERLPGMLRWYAPSERAAGWRFWIEGWAFAGRDERATAITRELDDRWKAAFSDLLAEGRAAGEFRVADPRATTLRVHALLDGLAIQQVVYRRDLPDDTLRAWATEALARELGIPADRLTPQLTQQEPPQR